MTNVERRLKVCVVGAGAAGLCALRHLANSALNFDPAAFEQTDGIGGTWVYNENVGLDENGSPIHSSMYKNLRTNLPSEIMNFPDWTKMGGGDRSCVTHREVLAYLQDYADHFELNKFIQFTTRVESVRPEITTERTVWKVKIKNLKTSQTEDREFDAVMVCNGHFFDPSIPVISGVESFPGQVIHSHVYRKPEDFSGKTVVILGASSSGVDIGIELSEHAYHVYLSHNNPRLASSLPPNITQVSGVDRIEGNYFFFKDGTSLPADTFIYCTGYHYTYPFFDTTCGIKVDDNYVSPLYRHLINVEHPSMCIMGIPSLVVPFPLFHMQVQYFLAVLKGVAVLPAKEAMLEDSNLRTTLKRHAHRLADKQWEYGDNLARDGGFDPLLPKYKAGYNAWKVQRSGNLLHYKDSKFIVSEDGTSVQIIQN